MYRKKYTRDRLLTLHKSFQPLVDALLKCGEALGLNVQISCGFRSEAEQAVLFAVGRTRPGNIVTNAMPGQSAHNHGLGVDLFFLDTKGKASFDPKLYRKLDKAAQAVGLYEKGLFWSGNWSTFKEMAHWELTGWRTIVKQNKKGVTK